VSTKAEPGRSIANPDPQIQKELESFALRSHALEREAAVCA